MRIGVIGAGISGMAAALALARRGHQVEVFQRENGLGGLIATFDFAGTRIEHFYHFLCGTDFGYFGLCRELGLDHRIRFVDAPTGFYHDGRSYRFSSALDLLRFSPLPFSQRLRFGIFALEARWRREWVQLDEMAARPWLIDRLGRRAYEVIWEPLLALKFGDFHDRISAAWVWHRLHRVAQSRGKMGYLEGGTGLLLDTLAGRLRELGVAVHPGRPVRAIHCDGRRVSGLGFDDADHVLFDRVVSTVPMPVLADLLPESEAKYAAQLRRIDYIGVVCLLFKLRRPVSRNFWLNVNDPRVPFNGIIEYTNLNPLSREDGHIVYVPYYVDTSSARYSMPDEAVLDETWQALKTIAPHLGDDDVLARHVARAPYAQAICPVDFLKAIPEQRSPVQGLHLLDSIFLCPEDRTQSGHITRAEACAEDIGP